MSERLQHDLQQRNKREKKLQTPEGEGSSREGRTLADSQPQGGNSKRTGSPRVPGEPTVKRRKPHPKEKAPSLKGNLQTGDKVG